MSKGFVEARNLERSFLSSTREALTGDVPPYIDSYVDGISLGETTCIGHRPETGNTASASPSLPRQQSSSTSRGCVAVQTVPTKEHTCVIGVQLGGLDPGTLATTAARVPRLAHILSVVLDRE